MSAVTAATPQRASAFAMSIRQNRGFYGAILLLTALYLVYNFIHPRGFSTRSEERRVGKECRL